MINPGSSLFTVTSKLLDDETRKSLDFHQLMSGEKGVYRKKEKKYVRRFFEQSRNQASSEGHNAFTCNLLSFCKGPSASRTEIRIAETGAE